MVAARSERLRIHTQKLRRYPAATVAEQPRGDFDRRHVHCFRRLLLTSPFQTVSRWPVLQTAVARNAAPDRDDSVDADGALPDVERGLRDCLSDNVAQGEPPHRHDVNGARDRLVLLTQLASSSVGRAAAAARRWGHGRCSLATNSSAVLSLLAKLHGAQAATKLPAASSPPRARGIMCSTCQRPSNVRTARQ